MNNNQVQFCMFFIEWAIELIKLGVTLAFGVFVLRLMGVGV